MSAMPEPTRIPEEMTINVFERSDGDYEYNIYAASPEEVAEDTPDPDGGGVCTSTMQEALLMACQEAREWIAKREIAALRDREKKNSKDITR